jgi:hypothetical protein
MDSLFLTFFPGSQTEPRVSSWNKIKSKRCSRKRGNLECLDGVAGAEQRSGQFQAQIVQAHEPNDSSRSHSNLQIDLDLLCFDSLFLFSSSNLRSNIFAREQGYVEVTADDDEHWTLNK